MREKGGKSFFCYLPLALVPPRFAGAVDQPQVEIKAQRAALEGREGVHVKRDGVACVNRGRVPLMKLTGAVRAVQVLDGNSSALPSSSQISTSKASSSGSSELTCTLVRM